ncbi:MAG: PD-(D/E)XK nuclease family protein, partial [Candidatus Marinimicrobia bacterium]|nr:PD-(D/E)XK nuclease family protein [Candidatus Neomarinimicrobiota bacterium]
SSLEGLPVGKKPKLTEAIYGESMRLFPHLEPMERGLLLHHCFEVLSGHSERAEGLDSLDGHSFDEVTREAIARSVQSFDQWMEQTWSPLSLDRELPFVSLDLHGTVVNGVMDLLVETKAGFWIIDHKSAQTDDLELRFATYLPQLVTYAEAVRQARPDKPVLGVGVNWISEGNVMWK